ncbi:type III pantothenate kinase [Sulfuriroseicoccus oceanibius]|uniref:Type III pantothenate kinase n=1 Tax=Sulfuriroseicoccus oceanibius TaxID=2707525 RepID=A0A6B3L6B1_9BACT|nr:type III pantothenate kinase [Sulfuriroseicoccus oceanibius]QQL45415.1 type III pantothenate kinase [Sulfuriroseicoccus oceanibius]
MSESSNPDPVRAPRVLAIDLSNQQIKLSGGGEGVGRCPTPKQDPAAMRGLVESWLFETRYDAVAVASVVPDLKQVVERVVKIHGLPLIEANHETASALGMMDFSHYAGVATLGDDRVANIIAACDGAENEAVVAFDLGTATTVDVAVFTDEGYRYLGGSIAPGVNALGTYLGTMTSQLPTVDPAEIDDAETPAIGTSTRGAISAALLYGYPGMIAGILEATLAELATDNVRVVVTGGAADLFCWDAWPEAERDPSLTVRGVELLGMAGIRMDAVSVND